MQCIFVFTDISGQRISPIFQGQAAQEERRPSQAKVLTGGWDLRKAQVDVPLSVSHPCFWPHRWAL